jgi:hypothetical protein
LSDIYNVTASELIKEEEKILSKYGLVLAQGSLADLADLDSFLDDIYKAREESFERAVKVFDIHVDTHD